MLRMKRCPFPGKEMMPITQCLGPVLRGHREKSGLTIEVVARRAGITPVALHRLETCKASSLGDTYERVAEAIALVESKRDGDGRWPLENQHPGMMPVALDEGEGRPSRWNTLRALRVLEWYSARN